MRINILSSDRRPFVLHRCEATRMVPERTSKMYETSLSDILYETSSRRPYDGTSDTIVVSSRRCEVTREGAKYRFVLDRSTHLQ